MIGALRLLFRMLQLYERLPRSSALLLSKKGHKTRLFRLNSYLNCADSLARGVGHPHDSAYDLAPLTPCRHGAYLRTVEHSQSLTMGLSMLGGECLNLK